MKPVEKRKATGFLAKLIANPDKKELARTKKRMLLAVKIADAIKEAGYSQKDFAVRMNKSETVISEWLSGGRNFTIDTLADIEEALGIRLLDISSLNVVRSDARATSDAKSKEMTLMVSNKIWSVSINNFNQSQTQNIA